MKKSKDLERPITAVPQTSSISSSRLTASPWRADRVADLELGLGERLRFPVQCDLTALAVYGDRPRDHRTGRGRGVTVVATHPPHYGVDPRQQHGLSHRFDQIVVGARAQAKYHRAVAVSRGHDDHRHCRGASQGAQHVETIHIGQAEVQQHQITALDPMQGVGAAAALNDGGACVTEELGQRRRDSLVILDKQHLHGADARNLWAKPAQC